MAKGTEGNKIRTITCQRCGTVVTKRMPPGRLYCSLGCYRGGPRPARRTGESRACRHCGATFYVPANRVLKGEGDFCTLACHNADQGRAKTEHTCKMCGSTFRWSPSRSASGNYNITYCSLDCRNADPERTARLVAMNALLQSGRTTNAEVLGYALLDQLKVDYLRQQVFAGKFTPDAVIPAARLVIQFDGDYWHDRDGASTEPRIRRRVSLDRSQDTYVRTCGWDVIRFWHSDLKAAPEACADRLTQLLHRPLGAGPSRDPLAPASAQTEVAASV